MTSFLTAPTNFRLLGFNLSAEEPLPNPHQHRGIVTIVTPQSDDPEPILAHLRSIPRFNPPLPPSQVSSRNLWGPSPLSPPAPSQLSKPEERVANALYNFLALNHQRIYHDTRGVTRDQAQLVSGIKRLESIAQNTLEQADKYKKQLNEDQELLVASMVQMHQEVANTRFYLQSTFASLRRAREALDILLLREGGEEELIEARNYPNIHKLTYRHRLVRPRSYHPQLHSNPNDDIKPRSSLDSTNRGDIVRSWSISKAGAFRHLQSRDRGSLNSLSSGETSDDPSLSATAVSQVHLANSKTYRQDKKKEQTNTNDGDASDSSKRKSLSLRASLSLASLRSLRRGAPPTPPIEDKPLNAKDRLHQIAAASPPPQLPTPPPLSRWFPAMFRPAEYAPKPSRRPTLTSNSVPPTLPPLDSSISCRIVLTPEENTSLTLPHRGRLPSFSGLLIEGNSALVTPSPLQNEIG